MKIYNKVLMGMSNIILVQKRKPRKYFLRKYKIQSQKIILKYNYKKKIIINNAAF